MIKKQKSAPSRGILPTENTHRGWLLHGEKPCFSCPSNFCAVRTLGGNLPQNMLLALALQRRARCKARSPLPRVENDASSPKNRNNAGATRPLGQRNKHRRRQKPKQCCQGRQNTDTSPRGTINTAVPVPGWVFARS